jgi:glyoxylase-like metal-dependent hydrolase (beta-lactamase superfamily II)
MTVQLYAFTCGTVTSDRERFLDGESGKITVPVPAYLIVHPQGKVLFDTGLNIAVRQEKERLLGPLAESQEIDFPAGADIVSHLSRLGVAPGEIRFVVNSHLHYDHCGGNAFFPNATMVIHAKEWRASHMKVMQDAGVYNPVDFEHMASVMHLTCEQDLFGDGTAVVFPTPGHTPGHQSMRVKLASADIVLAADCCYLKQTLDAMHLPKFSYNVAQMKESLSLLRRLQADGARIFFGHDPEFWKTVPQAPAAIV